MSKKGQPKTGRPSGRLLELRSIDKGSFIRFCISFQHKFLNGCSGVLFHSDSGWTFIRQSCPELDLEGKILYIRGDGPGKNQSIACNKKTFSELQKAVQQFNDQFQPPILVEDEFWERAHITRDSL